MSEREHCEHDITRGTCIQCYERLQKENEMLRRVLAVARMANISHPDIRLTNALKDWDGNK